MNFPVPEKHISRQEKKAAYKKQEPDDTFGMIYFFAAGTAFGIAFPMFFRIRLAYDGTSKKLFYQIRSYFGLPVNAGYLSFDKKYLVAHFSDKKAIAFPYGKLIPGKYGAKPFRHIEVLSVKATYLCGNAGETGKITAAVLWRVLSSLFLSVYAEKKDFLKVQGSDILLSEQEGDGFFFESTVIFNTVSVIEMIVGSIIGRMKKNAEK